MFNFGQNHWEKNITEMATAMCKNYGGCNQCMFYPSCDVRSHALRVYDDGWRKQIEAEWTLNRDGSGTCSNCHFTQRGVYDQDSYQRYCGCCGTKMKLKEK